MRVHRIPHELCKLQITNYKSPLDVTPGTSGMQSQFHNRGFISGLYRGDAIMSTAEVAEPVTSTGSAIQNKVLAQWVEEVAKLCKPDQVHICDGSADEYQE